MHGRALTLAALVAASWSWSCKPGAVAAPPVDPASPATGGAAPADPLLDARAAVSAWLASRAGRAGALDVHVDQYVAEAEAGGVKVMFVGFPPSGRTGGATLVELRVAGRRIAGEKSTELKETNTKDIPLGYGSTSVTSLFPKGWVPSASAAGGECDERDRCDPRLELFPDGGLVRVPLGAFRNNPAGEGDTGGYEAAMRVVPVAAGSGAVAGSMLVVVDNREAGKPVVLARRGTLIGKGPRYPVLWTGDLAKDCRLSVLMPATGPAELAYGCGGAPATRVEQGAIGS